MSQKPVVDLCLLAAAMLNYTNNYLQITGTVGFKTSIPNYSLFMNLYIVFQGSEEAHLLGISSSGINLCRHTKAFGMQGADATQIAISYVDLPRASLLIKGNLQ